MDLFSGLFVDLYDVLFLGLFVVLVVAFLAEFRLMRARSWLVLSALAGMGWIFLSKARRRRELLAQLQEREKALKALEREYDALFEQQKITRRAYEQAKEELERAKKDAALDLARLDAELAERIKELERRYDSMSAEELIDRLADLLGS